MIFTWEAKGWTQQKVWDSHFCRRKIHSLSTWLPICPMKTTVETHANGRNSANQWIWQISLLFPYGFTNTMSQGVHRHWNIPNLNLHGFHSYWELEDPTRHTTSFIQGQWSYHVPYPKRWPPIKVTSRCWPIHHPSRDETWHDKLPQKPLWMNQKSSKNNGVVHFHHLKIEWNGKH